MSSRQRIIVPSRAVNGGFDMKFETNPYNINLYNIMTRDDYTDAIMKVNDFLRPSRSTKLDGALLATGMMIVPLAVWGVRHGQQTKKRKRLLLQAIDDFNRNNPHLLMRYNKRSDSFLSIEQRDDNAAVQVQTLPEAMAEAVEPLQQEHAILSQHVQSQQPHEESVPDLLT